MRFLIDAQLPSALARMIRQAGHDAEHVGDCGLADARDPAIWIYAERAGAVIVTKDEDFARRRATSRDGPKIVWIRLPNTRRKALLGWFARVLPDILRRLEDGDLLIELVEVPT